MSIFSFFKKRSASVSLEQQLEVLSTCGVVLSSEVKIEDLFMFHSRAELEANTYKDLIVTLGYEMERDPFVPLCNRLWMCDYERIEDTGSYAEIIERLHRMSEHSLPLSDIDDLVDIEANTAWVEFDLEGSRIHWDAEVDNDWLDPTIVVRFNSLLNAKQSPYRIYSNHTDFGQCAFFSCFTQEEFRKFVPLAGFGLREIW